MLQPGGADPPPAAPAPTPQSFSFPPQTAQTPPRFLTPAVNRFHCYCTVNPINVFLVFLSPPLPSGLSSPLPVVPSPYNSSPSIVLPRQSGTVCLVVLSLTSGVSLTTVALCVVVLLCPVVLWEDVMWESLVQRSATPLPKKKRKKKKDWAEKREKI